jgi:hypothetical protein
MKVSFTKPAAGAQPPIDNDLIQVFIDGVAAGTLADAQANHPQAKSRLDKLIAERQKRIAEEIKEGDLLANG